MELLFGYFITVERFFLCVCVRLMGILDGFGYLIYLANL